MRTLQKIISRYLYRIAVIIVVLMLALVFFVEVKNEQRLAYESSTRTFQQMEQVLEENQKELEELEEEYRQNCLRSAEAIALILENDPEIMDNVEELQRIAELIEVDEIHIFDETGCIVAGTNPEYYGLTFDSGEQVSFFKPLLEDKTLRLVQDITPNTAEGKQMQYSALWSSNGEFIVQVGMNAAHVIKVTEKNELSYMFALFRISPEANYYAIDAESGKIVGSTNLESVGESLTEIGLSLDKIAGEEKSFHAKVNGEHSYCVFKLIGTNYIGRVVASSTLYQDIPMTMLLLLICLSAIVLSMTGVIVRHMDKLVVEELNEVNGKLRSIANGDFEETVDIQSSVEFSELSEHINGMVKNLLDNSKKMSYVLSKTNLYIGVYDYNKYMKKISYTDAIPKILAVEEEKMRELSCDVKRFREFMDQLRENPIPNEPGVYRIGDRYVRLEEIKDDDERFGVAVDVTAEIIRRRELEAERDIDLLTGLYNRRGLDIKLTDLFQTPEKLGCSAIIMIDADGLKGINDNYGHDMGDVYLKKVSEIIDGFGSRHTIAARQGGDEFVLFLYGYEYEEELVRTIETLAYIQNHSISRLRSDLTVPIRFSFGYSMYEGGKDYQNMLKEADEKMYQNKQERKKAALQNAE